MTVTLQRDRHVGLVISRFDPAVDAELQPARRSVPAATGWSVLDALNFVKDELDGASSYRWSCRMGICGSCGMMIDGEPRLACSTFLCDPGEEVQTGPLADFLVGQLENLAPRRAALALDRQFLRKRFDSPTTWRPT